MRFSAAATAAFIGLVAANPVPAPINGFPDAPQTGDKPDPSKVYIEDVKYGGTGCPQGTVSTILSDDRSTFTLLMDKYIVSTGDGVPITEARKNCQINVKIHYPQGFQYSIFTADYRGYASLVKGATGYQTVTYYFSGQQGQCTVESRLPGPLDKSYEIRDVIPTTSTVWSPCGVQGMLNMNSQIRIDNRSVPKTSNLMTTDSIDGKFAQVYALQWLKC